MKTKNYYAYPAHKTGYTREQHALLRRGEVLVIDHEGLVGRGHLPEELYYAWGRPDFHKRVRISGYDTFRGWGEEYERGTCLIYGTLGTVWEFVLPNGLTLSKSPVKVTLHASSRRAACSPLSNGGRKRMKICKSNLSTVWKMPALSLKPFNP